MDSKKVYELYHSSMDTKKVIDFISVNYQDEATIPLEELALGVRIERRRVFKVFVALEDAGVGDAMRGRQTTPSRFELAYKVKDIQRALANPGHKPQPFRDLPEKGFRGSLSPKGPVPADMDAEHATPALPAPAPARPAPMLGRPKSAVVALKSKAEKATPMPKVPSKPSPRLYVDAAKPAIPTEQDRPSVPAVNIFRLGGDKVVQIPTGLSKKEKELLIEFLNVVN